VTEEERDLNNKQHAFLKIDVCQFLCSLDLYHLSGGGGAKPATDRKLRSYTSQANPEQGESAALGLRTNQGLGSRLSAADPFSWYSGKREEGQKKVSEGNHGGSGSEAWGRKGISGLTTAEVAILVLIQSSAWRLLFLVGGRKKGRGGKNKRDAKRETHQNKENYVRALEKLRRKALQPTQNTMGGGEGGGGGGGGTGGRGGGLHGGGVSRGGGGVLYRMGKEKKLEGKRTFSTTGYIKINLINNYRLSIGSSYSAPNVYLKGRKAGREIAGGGTRKEKGTRTLGRGCSQPVKAILGSQKKKEYSEGAEVLITL